jgi:hypothetical protein
MPLAIGAASADGNAKDRHFENNNNNNYYYCVMHQEIN